MTGFAERLKEAGYTTAFAGKWGTRKFMRGLSVLVLIARVVQLWADLLPLLHADAGMATPAHTPHGR